MIFHRHLDAMKMWMAEYQWPERIGQPGGKHDSADDSDAAPPR
jgi:hypothetical protein